MPTEAEQAAAKIKEQFDTALKDVQAKADDALGRATKGEQLGQSAKDEIDKALTDLKTLGDQVATLEQTVAEGSKGRGGADDEKSLGEKFAESDSFKALHATPGQRGRASMEVKATLTSATTANPGSVGAGLSPTRIAGVIQPPERRLRIRDLLTPGQMDGNSLEFVRETGFTNNAAGVAEGARKPESDLRNELVSTSARVIAHYIKASRQILDDIPQLRSQIDGRLIYGLKLKEDSQLLNGDGAGQNLLGLIPQATPYNAPFALAGATAIDIMRLALLQASLAEYPATGFVMNPIDWTRVELTKDGEGRYIIGNPTREGNPTLWGQPVVETQAMGVDKFLAGAFRMGAQLFDRWLARVELATENEDDFVKNLVTLLAEERLALAVYRPEAFVYGDLGFVA